VSVVATTTSMGRVYKELGFNHRTNM